MQNCNFLTYKTNSDNMETKITQATVRIALSMNYSTFEVSASIENADGLTTTEINDARKQVQELANESVSDFKKQPDPNFNEKLKKAQMQIDSLNREISEKRDGKPEVAPVDVAVVESYPLYTDVKANKPPQPDKIVKATTDKQKAKNTAKGVKRAYNKSAK